MKYLQKDFVGGSSSSVIVTLNDQANVMLLRDAEFCAYRGGRRFQYHGAGPLRHRSVCVRRQLATCTFWWTLVAGPVRFELEFDVMQDRG